MTPRRSPGRHLDARTALDYLEGLLPHAGRTEVEEHLAGPCPECHERVRALGRLIERMRRDRTPVVPESLRALALAAFAPATRPEPAGGMLEAVARLVFDSWASPLPAATRRAVGEARRLHFALMDDVLELECETEAAGLVSLRGRLRASDSALFRLEVETSGERFTALPDSSGRFALERVPAGEAHLTVTGPTGRFRLPPLTM
ncbi:MAG: zf-HC2 domain-containing protein [Candidatus Eisenbacteria bacterium]|nr:zf-HC2 domain-containing protein [Candidatus Eisenbacteria bacterium]